MMLERLKQDNEAETILSTHRFVPQCSEAHVVRAAQYPPVRVPGKRAEIRYWRNDLRYVCDSPEGS
ncbi:hypothetical protein E2C01_068409 [Portunus trituberculatus]|uniref:Uncharacterized protein n=1 Tax=Portunus trituberculatus TaxID=210409 RepID=A0A5B7HZZ9_PORTR|nr:hypothetical protein [Portunus trituberculatus]